MEIYISREKLLDSFKKSANHCREWKAQATDEAIKARVDAALATWIECIMRTEQQPTADVEEVRHGKWIVHKIGGKVWKRQCSVCKAYYRGISPFCKECGAKMDGGKE